MFKKILSVRIPQCTNVCSSAVVKCNTGDLEVPGSIPGLCISFVCIFFCFFYFSVLFFFSFFDKRTESKGIHMLLEFMSSLKMRGL